MSVSEKVSDVLDWLVESQRCWMVRVLDCDSGCVGMSLLVLELELADHEGESSGGHVCCWMDTENGGVSMKKGYDDGDCDDDGDVNGSANGGDCGVLDCETESVTCYLRFGSSYGCDGDAENDDCGLIPGNHVVCDLYDRNSSRLNREYDVRSHVAIQY